MDIEQFAADTANFKVFDIALDQSAEDMADALNAQCGADHYVTAVVPIPGALRVVVRAKPGTIRPADEDRAIELVRAHTGLSVMRKVAMLKANGIRRSQGWVSQQHYNIEAERNAGSR